jgi:hypothetical protein
LTSRTNRLVSSFSAQPASQFLSNQVGTSCRHCGPENPPPGTIDEHAVERRLDPGQLRGDSLPEIAAVPKLLGSDPTNRLLRLGDQGVKLVTAADVQ